MNAEFNIAVIDYGMGNVRSIKNVLLHIGNFQVKITSNPEEIRTADCLILPGVGAFPDAVKNLEKTGLIELLNEVVLEKKKPILGICLGMQLLFTSSSEGGENKGLDWIPGHIEYIQTDDDLRVPHVGWNELYFKKESVLFDELEADKNFYFVHSYHAICEEKYVTATFEYGREFTAAVQRKNIFGMQFHPEKSQQNGFNVLRQFIKFSGGEYYA